MPFPDVERVIYSNSPLAEVICQLRFPPILKISAEEPHAFQERVRHIYPNFSTTTPAEALPQNAPDFLRPLLQAAFQDPSLNSGIKQFRFSDPDEEWNVFLSRDALGLTTTHYVRWEDFRDRYRMLVSALLEVYTPAYFTRIGLRYKDLLSPARAGNANYTWQHIIEPHILGELGNSALEGLTVAGAKRELSLELERDLLLTLNHGFVQEEGQEGISYLIDADYHKESRLDTEQWITDFERCHWHAGRIFRWCITKTLHQALGPIPA